MPFKTVILLLIAALGSFSLLAQKQQLTEFTKGGLLLIKINSGLTSDFTSKKPDLYTGGLGLNPQVTIIENTLRLGANAALNYNDKKLFGLFGPMAALRLKTFELGYAGSVGNLQLLAEANWGTAQQKLVGGGLAFEIGKSLQLGITAQRDYNLNNWWLQTFIGLQFNKTKKEKPVFD